MQQMEQRKLPKSAINFLLPPLMCFHYMGSVSASLDEIAQLADMHKSNIFYYYENKVFICGSADHSLQNG